MSMRFSGVGILGITASAFGAPLSVAFATDIPFGRVVRLQLAASHLSKNKWIILACGLVRHDDAK